MHAKGMKLLIYIFLIVRIYRFLDVANVPNDNINENVFTIKRRYFVVMARV